LTHGPNGKLMLDHTPNKVVDLTIIAFFVLGILLLNDVWHPWEDWVAVAGNFHFRAIGLISLLIALILTVMATAGRHRKA